MSEADGWKEIFEGGSAEAEHTALRAMAEEIVETLIRLAGEGAVAGRSLFAKTIAGIDNAQLLLDNALPADLATGHFRPAAILPVAIRFSNASRVAQSDTAPDIRGIGLRLSVPGGADHDLVCSTAPAPFYRNAHQLHAFALASADGRELLLARLAARLGPTEAKRIALFLRESLRLCASLALEHFWSAGAILWGGSPVRLALHPMADDDGSAAPTIQGDNVLRRELGMRLAAGDLRYRLAVQRFVDERRTPIEDASVVWRENVTRSVAIGTIIIPQCDILGAEGEDVRARVDAMQLNPWNSAPEFRPLGSHNRLLQLVYASVAKDDHLL